MSTAWRDTANKPAGAVKIADIKNYLKKTQHKYSAPIDRYYDHRLKVILSGKPELLEDAPWLSGYMLVSLISATEMYFREIFSYSMSICPISRKMSSEKNMQIGAALWHGQKKYTRAVFEHISLADIEKIKSCSKDYLGFEIKRSSSTFAALSEFDKLCELRHGIVHSAENLPGKNAIKLMIGKAAEESIIEFDAVRLQEGAAICTSLVESYNKELYEKIIERWATKWRETADWTPEKELKALKEICSLFHSTLTPAGDRPSLVKLRNSIKREYNL